MTAPAYHRPGHRSARRLCLWLALAPTVVLAQMDLSPLTVTNTINWVSGDVAQQSSFCVESFDEAPDKKSATLIPYRLTASIGGGTAPFTLANGAQTVPVGMTWTDTVTGTVYPLSPGVATPEVLTGRVAGCPGGNNGLLTMTVLNTDLGLRPAGTYSRTFTIEAVNTGSGRTRRSASVTLSVVIPPVIRISNIDDLMLGTFNGVNDLVLADTVCVYRNGGSLYGITATGNGPGGAFAVANGAVSVPYTVTWQDTLGTLPLTPGVQAPGRGNANTTSATCSGGAANNATYTVRITAASLLTALQPGAYTGVLTLMVIPQ